MFRRIVTDKKSLKQENYISPIDGDSFCIARDLVDTMIYNWNQGRVATSISANQIGEHERIIAVAENRGSEITVMFNPCITMKREEQTYWEDNFCRENKLYKNERAYEINVTYFLKDCREVSVNYRGKMAALIQQEIDNIEGILPEERASMVTVLAPRKPSGKIFGR